MWCLQKRTFIHVSDARFFLDAFARLIRLE